MNRPITLTDRFRADVDRWLTTSPERGERIARLMEWTIQAPKEGPGRPKRLARIPGGWSRRITRRHRLIYVVDEGGLTFVSCWGHEAPDALYDEARTA